ncbi:caspase family protein [Sediminitomix flava]|uniref:Uncharacterized protein DUF4384 n=1 Tax=Sediminitomix flava TaxID=379075 RepID=A0A315Z8G1_SEDFL|nr:caspase family protein [Sediminitomix flava]PWJ39316.1 uncharacterized protein DUF4384 [Sediminitomix flava]
MKRLLFYITIFLFLSMSAFSIERKALIIGINNYEPKEGLDAVKSDRMWINLDGSVNDALSMKSILLNKFGFVENNIITLVTPEETTRDKLIEGFKKLAAMTQKGDEVFIYYAGHGSQVVNSRSPEVDKLDETIVPSDSYTGVLDIRDKELNELFSKIQDKGAVLTIIFDSCNSGSVSRSSGLPEMYKARAIRRDNRDVKEPFDPIDIASKGALVISASQDYELAKEFTDPDGQKHGAFTYAFMKALRESSPNESALNLFKRTRSILLYMGVPSQHPVFEGNISRSRLTLFGSESEEKYTKVAISDKEKDVVELDGGFAIGLSPGTTLASLNEDGVELQVTEMTDINSCLAKVINGKLGDIEIGDFYRITGMPFIGNRALKVWYSCSNYKAEDLKELHNGIGKIASKYELKVLEELTVEDVSIKCIFDGTAWQLVNHCGEKRMLPIKFDEASFEEGIKSLVNSGCMEFGNTIWVNYPPVKGVGDLMEKTFLHEGSGVEKTLSIPEATYWLSGRFNKSGQLEYAWYYSELSAELYPLPNRTNWVLYDSDRTTFESLYRSSNQISKLYAWMTLPSPSNDASFPYSLAIRDVISKKVIKDGNTIEGSVYEFVMMRDEALFKKWNRRDRFIYIFMMDSNGQMTLVFPRNSSVENNTYTLAKSEGGKYLEEVVIPKSKFRVGPPYGADTFFMLSSKEPLNDPWVLESPAVVTRGGAKVQNPIDILLNRGVQRGDKKASNSSDWYIERFTLYSQGE